MILYNVTLKVSNKVSEDWIHWMQNIHIPDVMKTGLFLDYRMSRLLGVDDTEGPTYSIQYRLASHEHLESYQKNFASSLQKDHTERYGDQVLAFRTLMEIVQQGQGLPSS